MMEIFKAAASGELEGTEKTDGQNLFVGYNVAEGVAKAGIRKGMRDKKRQELMDMLNRLKKSPKTIRPKKKPKKDFMERPILPKDKPKPKPIRPILPKDFKKPKMKRAK